MKPAVSPGPRSSLEMEPIAASPGPAAKDGIDALRAINTREEAEKEAPPQPLLLPDGRWLLTEEAGYKHTGFSFPDWKKWAILTTIFLVQLSMNWNAAIYGNAIPGLKGEFAVDDFQVRIGQMVFLVAVGLAMSDMLSKCRIFG